MDINKMIQSMAPEVQARLLETAVKEKNIDMVMQITQILCEVPISEGGMSSEDIATIVENAMADMPDYNTNKNSNKPLI